MADLRGADPVVTLRPRRRKRIVVAAVLVALLLAAIGLVSAGTWFYVAARAALPQLDGTIRLSGISGKVTIIRDQRGVPHIRAENLEDLFWAQGYVTAQDRLWQMNVIRRYAGGGLALGPSVARNDRTSRLQQNSGSATLGRAWVPGTSGVDHGR